MSWDKYGEPIWKAVFVYDSEIHNLGSFLDKRDAAVAWDTKCYAVLHDKNLLNFQ